MIPVRVDHGAYYRRRARRLRVGALILLSFASMTLAAAHVVFVTGHHAGALVAFVTAVALGVIALELLRRAVIHADMAQVVSRK